MNDIKLADLPKMMVIYSALKDGWEVSMISGDKFKFTKQRVHKELTLNDYFESFKNYFKS